jgi:hypothetical protein
VRWLIALAGLYWLARSSNDSSWLDSLMLRAYAPDNLRGPRDAPDYEAFEQASHVAQHSAIPIGWVLELQEQVPPDRLLQAAKAAREVYRLGGPPSSTTEEELAMRREQAIRGGIKAVEG